MMGTQEANPQACSSAAAVKTPATGCVFEASTSHHPSSNVHHSSRLPTPAPRLLRLFDIYLQRYVAKNLHSVQLSRDSWRGPVAASDGPVIIYLNHPSWWDPLVCMIVCQQLFAERLHFAAIDARALQKYRLFERMGFFGVEQESRAGARRFLEVGSALLTDPRNGARATLWVTAEGHFTDPRKRPVELRAGVAHLASRLSHGLIIPMAIEYDFWQERTAEALVRFGMPIRIADHPQARASQWLSLMTQALQTNMDALAEQAISRDPKRFTPMLRGRGGVGGIYDQWRRFKALVTGRKFVASHADES